MAETEYKVVEIPIVTDVELERVLNETARDGWSFDGIQFAMSDASRRPTMAFLIFKRSHPHEDG